MTTPKLKRADFNNLFKKGKTIAGKLVFLKLKKNKQKLSRFAIVVGLKVSKKSTTRNKIKRQLKEIIGKSANNIKSGFDMLIVVKPQIIGRKYREIEKEIEDLLQMI